MFQALHESLSYLICNNNLFNEPLCHSKRPFSNSLQQSPSYNAYQFSLKLKVELIIIIIIIITFSHLDLLLKRGLRYVNWKMIYLLNLSEQKKNVQIIEKCAYYLRVFLKITVSFHIVEKMWNKLSIRQFHQTML